MRNYDTQAVVCLDHTLYAAARSHAAKPRVRGESMAIGYNGRDVLRSALYTLGAQHVLPRQYSIPTARLIIVSHGTPNSRTITADTGQHWTPEQLANAVKCWLSNRRIKRIALKICYAGGNRGGAVLRTGEDLGAFLGRFRVDPRESFAYQFARRCGLAETITAQTGSADTAIEGTTYRDFDEDQLTDVFEKVDGERKGHAYKFILTPDPGASPTTPKEPGMSILNA